MRDHYFQLWDLEKNFGEKTLCGGDGKNGLNLNHQLEIAITGSKQSRQRRSPETQEKYTGEKSAGTTSKSSTENPTDPHGIGCGTESSPVGQYLSDCCVLNFDERDEFMQSIMRELPSGRNAQKHNCANMRIKKNGVERIGGGNCGKINIFERLAGLTWEENQKYFATVESRFLSKPFYYGRDNGWTAEKYFKWPKEGEWTPGYACRNTKTGFLNKANQDHQIFDEEINEWRMMTIADRLCWEGKGTDVATTSPSTTIKTTQSTTEGTKAPTAASTTASTTASSTVASSTTSPTAASTTPPPNTRTTVDPTTLQPMTEFTLGCKVADHNGPLAEGFVGNEKWRADGLVGRHKPNVANGAIDPADFGEWFDFANCMKSAMQILEGQAYFPEIMVEKISQKQGYFATSYPERKPYSDNGSARGKEQHDDDVLAGRPVGDSKLAKDNVKELFQSVKDQSDSINTQFHGAGSRFIESQNGSDSLVGRCAKFLPNSANSPYDIKPNYDMDMDRLGWYHTIDESGGGSNQDVRELVVESYINDVPQYRDDRNVQRYYQRDNTDDYLFKFDPQYHPVY